LTCSQLSDDAAHRNVTEAKSAHGGGGYDRNGRRLEGVQAMLAVMLALAAAVSFGGSDYTAGLAAREAGVLRVTLAVQAVYAALLICVVPAASSQLPSAPSLGWAAAAGVGGVAGAMTLYLGFRFAAFSVASPLSAVVAAGLSVAAGLLSGERPGSLALAGIALTVPAIVALSASAGADATSAAPGGGAAASGETTGGQARRQLAGVACGLGSGAGFALFLIGLNRAGSGTDLWPAGVAALVGLVLVACLAARAGEFGLPPPGTRRLCALTGAIAATGTISYFLATHRGLLAVTAVIYSLYPAGTIVLARALSGERLTAARITGLLLAAAAVALIAAGTVG
jgi:drug/metabolite transporter (DMT)-like permease